MKRAAITLGFVMTCGCIGEVAGENRSLQYEEAWNLDVDRAQLTIKELRLLATALEDYREDAGRYPISGGRGPVSLNAITSELRHRYLRLPFVRDGWGNDYQYWSTDGGRVLVISSGADGELDVGNSVFADGIDEAVRMLCGGEQAELSADIVWLDSNFCQWPKEDGED